MNARHDVIVVGAGPGGAAAGYYLARQGLDVLILDKSEFPRDKTCGDGLTPRAVAVLDDLGALPDAIAAGCQVGAVEVVAPNGRSTVAALPAREAVPEYALVVPRRTLDQIILNRAIAAGARFEGGARVTGVESGPDGVVVRADRAGREQVVTARLAIVATGASTGLLVQMSLLPRPPVAMLAARTYFEGIAGLSSALQLRFDGVTLPGYGWIFPTSEGSANVGAGFFPIGRTARRAQSTARAAYDRFVATPAVRSLLDGARQVGPVRGFPIRVDFLTAPTSGDRVLLVGEAAGLVNPLTGEGIDYALETGRLAADHAAWILAAGGPTPARMGGYDRLLHDRYDRLCRFCNTVRDRLLHGWALDRLVPLADRRPELKARLVDITLGNQPAPARLSARLLRRLLTSW